MVEQFNVSQAEKALQFSCVGSLLRDAQGVSPTLKTLDISEDWCPADKCAWQVLGPAVPKIAMWAMRVLVLLTLPWACYSDGSPTGMTTCPCVEWVNLNNYQVSNVSLGLHEAPCSWFVCRTAMQTITADFWTWILQLEANGTRACDIQGWSAFYPPRYPCFRGYATHPRDKALDTTIRWIMGTCSARIAVLQKSFVVRCTMMHSCQKFCIIISCKDGTPSLCHTLPCFFPWDLCTSTGTILTRSIPVTLLKMLNIMFCQKGVLSQASI